MNVYDQRKTCCWSRQTRRRKIYIQRERPVADWLPVREARETVHAVRKFYFDGRIVILEHHLSCHLGCWRGNLSGQGGCGKHDNRARHQRLLSDSLASTRGGSSGDEIGRAHV